MNHEKNIDIKVCGMTQIEQVQQLAALGVKYAGFIFYEKSPRYVVGKINPKELREFNTRLNKVGVFVNETTDKILQTVHLYGLDYVQLHGDETPEFCKEISANIKVIKSFGIGENTNPIRILEKFNDCVDLFLFDVKTEIYGGAGKKFDWNILKSGTIEKPFFLSGGIAPEDISLIKKFSENNIHSTHFSIDLNSRFEEIPGIKNMEKLKNFIEELAVQ
jgi:phosphoribosylanthranilate isomerase